MNNQPKEIEEINVSKLKLNLISDKNDYNEILIGLIDDVANDFESQYNAYKLPGFNSLAFYTFDNNMKYAIFALPISGLQADIKIGFDAPEPSNYTINLVSFNLMNYDLNLVLEDKLLNRFIDLNTQSNYPFFTENGTFKERFILHLNPPVITDVPKTVVENSQNNIKIYSTGAIVYISSPVNETATIELFNVLGQMVETQRIQITRTTTLQLRQSAGNYLMRIRTGEKSINQKILITNN